MSPVTRERHGSETARTPAQATTRRNARARPAPSPAGADTLSPSGFAQVTQLFEQVSGIRLTSAKHALVVGRLQRLAAEAGETRLESYVERLTRGEWPADEMTRLVDRLTTNETYFFREPAHFEHFAAWIQQHPQRPLRVWSGASSSGEEIYSLAMLMAETLGLPPRADWQILGTDLSTRMVSTARRGLYPMLRTDGIRLEWLKRWCLKGHGEYDGMLLIDRRLREHTRFEPLNLMESLPADMGPFDAIWLRNVLIYFETEPKARIVRQVLDKLAPDGVLYTGHAESLSSLGLPVRSIAPAVYMHG
jgi:chemotaxis protein methyltransferase CheR